MRRGAAADKLVTLLAAGPESEAAHRALLALRIMTDTEGDRAAVVRAGGLPHLVGLLRKGPYSEHSEYAAALLGNMAAGGQAIKDAIREVTIAHLYTAMHDPCYACDHMSYDSAKDLVVRSCSPAFLSRFACK